jgi:hypothetical protein
MSRMDRLREYAGKPKGLQGAGRSEANLKGWAERASENSQIAPRAKGPVHGGPPGTWGENPPSLPSTGKTTVLRDTQMSPRTARKVNARMAGKDDLNHEGSDYLKSIRCEA